MVFMPTFEEEGAYCSANVGRSVCRSLGRSIDQMVSDNYPENYVSQSFHILLADWSW